MNKYILNLASILLIASCSYEPSSSEMRDAELLISEIEKYKQHNGRSPKDEIAWGLMDKLGLDSSEACRPCYQKEGQQDYIIYFGTHLGESYIYDSKSKKWQ